MSDEIKIRVGVQNNVQAGMANVVRDIKKQGKNMGEGWAEGFKNAAQGNVQGALTGIFGGFIAGAAAAGWEAGKRLDAMLGLSDKVAKWWTSGAEAADAAWEKFRKNQLNMRKELSETAKAVEQSWDIKEKKNQKVI